MVMGLIHNTEKQNKTKKKTEGAGHQGLTPVILATQEAEIRRIEVQSQLGQIVK
jgi:hypothetical protein